MRNSRTLTVIALFCMAASCTPATPSIASMSSANSDPSVGQASLDALRARVAKVASPTATAVIITWVASQFSVTIENSALNDATHAARNSEALTIANAIVAGAASIPEFNDFLGIHVEYVARNSGHSKPRLVDSIDFRKASSGQILLHTT